MIMTRQKLLQLIHVAKRDLAMPDDSYRAIVRQIGGKDSAADLSDRDLDKLLKHLKRCGFKVRAKGSQRPLALDGQSSAIRAIWLQLADMGVVRDRSEKALGKYVHRMTGVDALQWLSIEQASAVIEQLKKWQSRIINARDKALREALSLPQEVTPFNIDQVCRAIRQAAEAAIGRQCYSGDMTEAEFQQVLQYVQKGAAA